VFGHSILLTHLVAVGLAAACLYLTFRIGTLLGGVSAGAVAMLLLLLHPLFFAQAGMMHGDMTVAALGSLAVLFYLQGRWRAYGCAAVALLLCKETGLGVVAAVAGYHLLFRVERERRFAESLALASPALVLALFFLATWWTTGRLVDNHYFDSNTLASLSSVRLRETSRWLLSYQGRWVLTTSITLALLLVPAAFARREIALCAMVVLPFWAVFSVIFVLPRYLLPAFPFLSVMAALALVSLGRRFWWPIPWLAVAVVAMVFVRKLPGSPDWGSNYETNMGYVGVVRTQQSLAGWLEENRPGATIAAAWPLSMNLEHPALGYVSRGFRVVGPTAPADLLVRSVPGAPENRIVRDRIEAERWRRLKRFGSGRRKATVYALGGG